MAKSVSPVASLSDVLNRYSAVVEETFSPTGLNVLDTAIGGGICAGAMYAIWGAQGSGKSTLALQVCKSYCVRGERVLWLDVEKSLNINQQEVFGIREYVESGLFLHVTASTYAEADEITSAVASDMSMGIKLVVIDSETMLLPKILDEQSVTDNQPGQKARQCSLWLTKVKSSFYKSGISCIVLSHARANITMSGNPYAPQDKIAGGFALKHIPDCIIQVSAGAKYGSKESPSYQVVHLTTDKNKFAPPFQKVDFKLFFGKGISAVVECVDSAVERGDIQSGGSGWYVLPNGDKVRGLDVLYGMTLEQLRDVGIY